MLVKALRDVLVPALRERGFEPLPLDGDDARSAEIRTAFPFGRFRRPRGDDFEQIEIQLDQHRRPAFRLNAALVPGVGIEHTVGHVPCESVWIHYMSQFAELYLRPALRTWFALPRWGRGEPAQADYEALVRTAAGLLPELEQAIGTAGSGWRFGSHVRQVRA